MTRKNYFSVHITRLLCVLFINHSWNIRKALQHSRQPPTLTSDLQGTLLRDERVWRDSLPATYSPHRPSPLVFSHWKGNTRGMPSSTICNLCDQICRSQLFPTPNQFQPTVAQPPSLRPSSPHSNSWNRPDGKERKRVGERKRGERGRGGLSLSWSHSNKCLSQVNKWFPSRTRVALTANSRCTRIPTKYLSLSTATRLQH